MFASANDGNYSEGALCSLCASNCSCQSLWSIMCLARPWRDNDLHKCQHIHQLMPFHQRISISCSLTLRVCDVSLPSSVGHGLWLGIKRWAHLLHSQPGLQHFTPWDSVSCRAAGLWEAQPSVWICGDGGGQRWRASLRHHHGPHQDGKCQRRGSWVLPACVSSFITAIRRILSTSVGSCSKPPCVCVNDASENTTICLFAHNCAMPSLLSLQKPRWLK